MSARTYTVTVYRCDNGHNKATFRRNLPVVDCPVGWGLGPARRQPLDPDKLLPGTVIRVYEGPPVHFCPACTVALGPGHLRTTRDGRTPEEQVAHAEIILKLQGAPSDRYEHQLQRQAIREQWRRAKDGSQ